MVSGNNASSDWLMDYDIINKGNMFSLLPLTILYLYVKCNLMLKYFDILIPSFLSCLQELRQVSLKFGFLIAHWNGPILPPPLWITSE